MPTPTPEMRQALVDAVATVVDLDPESITDHLDLRELGLDSLDLTTLVIEAEDRLGLDISAGLLDQLAETDGAITVGALLHLVANWQTTPDLDLALAPVVIDQT